MNLVKNIIREACASVPAPYSPVNLEAVEDYRMKVVLMEGEYFWHYHDFDELFYVYRGLLLIETEFGDHQVYSGESLVVPKGVRHKTSSKEVTFVLLFEHKDIQTFEDKSRQSRPVEL